jgi:hypothetical protein
MEAIQDNTNLNMSPEENQSPLNTNNSNQLKNLNILVNGIKLAQKRGAFEVHESAILWDAISGFLSEKPDTTELLN